MGDSAPKANVPVAPIATADLSRDRRARKGSEDRQSGVGPALSCPNVYWSHHDRTPRRIDAAKANRRVPSRRLSATAFKTAFHSAGALRSGVSVVSTAFPIAL